MLESELRGGSHTWNSSVVFHDGMHNARASLGALNYGPKEEQYILEFQVEFLWQVGAPQSEIEHAKTYNPHSAEAIDRQRMPLFK